MLKFHRTTYTSNLQLAIRDQKEQKKYFDLFNIETDVLLNSKNDCQFLTESMNCNFKDEDKLFESFNIQCFNCPVVYSTNSNFEFIYLHTVFNPHKVRDNFDIVLVDEVDNMFIDELSSPAIISSKINYNSFKDVLQIVFHLHNYSVECIQKVLNYFFPDEGNFTNEIILMLKNAAFNALQYQINVHYIIEDDQIVIIDQNTGFKKLGTRWSNFIHEMVEIKEGIEPENPGVSFCQITQHGYFNFYSKIVGLTGTIGSESDEEILRNGYSVNIFKIPRHCKSKLIVNNKERPNGIKNIFTEVLKEIDSIINERPVLVIWNTIANAIEFNKTIREVYRNNDDIKIYTILGITPVNDSEAIKNASNKKTITIATSAAGRGVDIKIVDESVLLAGGLHVIIPMNMASQRSLEQAAGRAGRQGQPGSVTIYKSDNDRYYKSLKFDKKHDNLAKLELKFSKYLMKSFSWIFSGKRTYYFASTIFPFNASYSDIFNILIRCLNLKIKENNLQSDETSNESLKEFQDLVFHMIQTAWGVFFTNLGNDEQNCQNDTACFDLYDQFINELEQYINHEKCSTVQNCINYIHSKFETDVWNMIFKGIEILSSNAFALFINIGSIVLKITCPGLCIILICVEEVTKMRLKGYKINWLQILAHAGFNNVRPFYKFNFEASLFLDIAETFTYQLLNNEKSSDIYEKIDEYDAIIRNSNFWLRENIMSHFQKSSKFPRLPIHITPSFIITLMKLANNAYDFHYKYGEIVYKNENNGIKKPVFYFVSKEDNLFILTRGSVSNEDWITDFNFTQKKVKLGNDDFYFHEGIYDAACYIFDFILDFDISKYDSIYFAGHSYGGGISTILCVLAYYNEKFKDKKIFAFSFAGPPTMSICPKKIKKCIFVFINDNDVVPYGSLYNMLNTVKLHGGDYRIFLMIFLALTGTIGLPPHIIYTITQSIFDALRIPPPLNQIFADKLTEVLSGDLNQQSREIFKSTFAEFWKAIADIENLRIRTVKGQIFIIGKNNAESLNDFRVNDSEISPVINIEGSSSLDHQMLNYIRVFQSGLIL